MARFRIIDMEHNGHYLNIPGTEWEQVEADSKTGRQVRHRYKVHCLLDPKDPMTHNYPETSEIIVSTKYDPAFPRDLVFIGSPTEGMEPLDDEARQLLAKLPRGISPMSEFALPSSGGFGPAPVAAAPNTDQLNSLLAQMQAQNALLMGQMDAMQRRIEELAEKEPELVEAISATAVDQAAEMRL